MEDLIIYFKYIADISGKLLERLKIKKPEKYSVQTLPKSKSSSSVPPWFIAAIAPEMIDEFMMYLERYESDGKIYHNNIKSKQRKLASIRSFYNFLCEREIAEKNPASFVKTPKPDEKDIIAFNSTDGNSILSSGTSGTGLTPGELKYHKNLTQRDTAIITLLMNTGIRVSELVGLDLENFNYEDSRIDVIRKGGKYDHVYINEETGLALMEYINGDKKEHPVTESDEKALFLSQKNQRLTVWSVERLVKKYSGQTQFCDRVTPHKFRSSFASDAIEKNDLTAVAATLGHKSTETTSKYYTKGV